jgi:hypothetical protein
MISIGDGSGAGSSGRLAMSEGAHSSMRGLQSCVGCPCNSSGAAAATAMLAKVRGLGLVCGAT